MRNQPSALDAHRRHARPAAAGPVPSPVRVHYVEGRVMEAKPAGVPSPGADVAMALAGADPRQTMTARTLARR